MKVGNHNRQLGVGDELPDWKVTTVNDMSRDSSKRRFFDQSSFTSHDSARGFRRSSTSPLPARTSDRCPSRDPSSSGPGRSRDGDRGHPSPVIGTGRDRRDRRDTRPDLGLTGGQRSDPAIGRYIGPHPFRDVHAASFMNRQSRRVARGRSNTAACDRLFCHCH